MEWFPCLNYLEDTMAVNLPARYELAHGTGATEDMWFPALADLGWQGWTYAKSLTIDQK
jgi:hypothetical protein